MSLGKRLINTGGGGGLSGYAFATSETNNSIVAIDVSDPTNLTIVDTLVDGTNLIDAYSLSLVK